MKMIACCLNERKKNDFKHRWKAWAISSILRVYLFYINYTNVLKSRINLQKQFQTKQALKKTTVSTWML